MPTPTYHARRGELLDYFDRTAVEAWERLTSDAPVSRIRATVRAGRDEMRGTLLAWLPADLRGARVLDAGSGTGAFAVEAARRGADVLAVDLSPRLVALARERAAGETACGRVEFRVGDMLDHARGRFDHVVAMDSLIHYGPDDMVRVLVALADRAGCSVLATFAPRTPLLSAMHAIGRLFPRGDRPPSIVPVSPASLLRRLDRDERLRLWRPGRTRRVASGFYVSQALELVRA